MGGAGVWGCRVGRGVVGCWVRGEVGIWGDGEVERWGCGGRGADHREPDTCGLVTQRPCKTIWAPCFREKMGNALHSPHLVIQSPCCRFQLGCGP